MEPIRKNRVLRLVYARGKSVPARSFVAFALKIRKGEDCGESLLGVCVSKKVGNAVVRNRVRRRVKESCRLRKSRVRGGFWVVVIARPQAKDLPWAQVDQELESLFSRHGLLL